MRQSLSLCLISIFLGTPASFAADRFNNQHFGVDVDFGFPEMIGVGLSYLGWSSLVPGISFGSLPVNNTLNRYVKLNPVAVPLAQGDNYNLYPQANYTIYSASFDLKWFISDSGFFTDFIFSSVTFGTSVVADLKNETTGGVSHSAVTGSGKLTQMMPGIMFGYQWLISSKFYMGGALGGAFLLRPSYSLSLSGSATDSIAVVPGGSDKFESAKTQIQAAFDSAVNTYQSTVKFVPLAYVNLGFTF